MGFLRKTIKKIGKGIKKLSKKFGKAFGKLGILGQIGFMLFMPQFASGMLGQLGTYAAKGTSILHKAAGAIHAGATAVGNAYNTVTKAIDNGFNRATNFIKGEGLVLSPDRASVFAKPTDITDTALPKGIKVSEAVPTGSTVVEKEQLNLLAKGKDIASKTYKETINRITDPAQLADSITSGALSGVASKVSMSIAGDPPTQRVLRTNFDVMNMSGYDRTGHFNTVDFTAGNNSYMSGGSSWGAAASLAAPFLTEEVFSGGDNNYAKRVSELRYTG